MENRKEELALCRRSLLLKALSNPIRLCIVRSRLKRGCVVMSSMQHCLELSQSTVSQHLARLRDLGSSKGARGWSLYRVVNPEAEAIIKLLF